MISKIRPVFIPDVYIDTLAIRVWPRVKRSSKKSITRYNACTEFFFFFFLRIHSGRVKRVDSATTVDSQNVTEKNKKKQT